MTTEFPHPETSATVPAPAAPEPAAWNLADLGIFLGLGVIAFVLAYAAAMLGYAGLAPLMRWPLPPRTFEQGAYLSLAAQLLFYLLLLPAIYLLVLMKHRLPMRQALRWRRLPLQRGLEFFAGGCLLSLLVQYTPTLVPERESFPLRQFFSTPALAYTVGVFAVLIAPLMEELVFRGVLFIIFESRFGLGWAVALTALLFAALHISEYWGAWNHLLMLLVVSLVFSLARGATGSVTPSYLLHLAYNGLMMLALYAQTRHFQSVGLLFLR